MSCWSPPSCWPFRLASGERQGVGSRERTAAQSTDDTVWRECAQDESGNIDPADVPTAEDCTVEPLTVDEVLWYVKDPYGC